MARRKRKPKNFAGADVYRSLLQGQPGAAPRGPALDDPKLAPLRQNLRVKHLYQEDKVDAAIEFEKERNPTGTMEGWMRAAIDRWERDNR